MPCYHPITGYRSKYVNPKTGKRSIAFNTSDGYIDLPVQLPCGNCIGCRLEYSRQWAIRCVHEAQLHEHNAFITLTYNEENLPSDLSIHKEELQKFFKRLRKNTGKKLRYFACGEYGDKSGRPHYHAIIFGYSFPDKTLWSKTKSGDLLYRSKTLEKCWKYGHSLIGQVTFESAAYVSRYVMKKRKGKAEENDKWYEMLDTRTGEVVTVQPEFCIMSRRPGIGKAWLEKYKQDTDKDYITIRGRKMNYPKYYDSLIEKMGEDLTDRKTKRLKLLKAQDNSLERLETREKVRKASYQPATREL